MAPSKFLAFDLETTGLPTGRRCGFRNLEAFDSCRILSFAVVEFENMEECGTYSGLIKPDGYEVSQESFQVHGISQEKALAEGRDFEDVYEELCHLFTQIPNIVGHNVTFDLNVISSEAYRRGLSTEIFENINVFCTLRMTREIFFEPMKLGIIYNKLFGQELKGAHDAVADARASGEIFVYYQTCNPRTYNPIDVKTIWIKVSDVAACIDICGFKKPMEIINNIWSKYRPETFLSKTKEQEHVEALEISPSVIKNVFSNTVTFTGTSEEVQKTFTDAANIIKCNTEMSKSQKELVTRHLQKNMYTNHGIKTESVTSDRLETDGVVKTDNTFYKLPICTIQGTQYVLCGRVDRVEVLPSGEMNLVEIKNRTRGLFRRVRDYENIQVQAYLQMNRSWAKACLVEQYNSEISKHIIERNDCLWADTMNKLVEFCKTTHHYISS